MRIIGVLPMVSRTLLYFMGFPCDWFEVRMVIRFPQRGYSFLPYAAALWL